jgi:outer membrane lipoprotein-sorting protein
MLNKHPKIPLLVSLYPFLFFSLANAQQASLQSQSASLSQLESHLASLKEVQTLHARFICEKRLAMLESPLVSSGELWIKKGQNKEPGSVRFSTETPYVSELILTDGKVHARSQHEQSWTTTNQSARPGLTAVMGQLGGWSTGDAGKVSDLYAVSVAPASEKIPSPPEVASSKGQLPKSFDEPHPDLFILTPTNKDLAFAVKQVTIAITPPTSKEPGKLLYIEITTAQDDQTRYWFFAGQINASLPADIFKPSNAPSPAPASRGNSP